MQVQMKVNGKSVSVDAAPNTLLVNALRDAPQTHWHSRWL